MLDLLVVTAALAEALDLGDAEGAFDALLGGGDAEVGTQRGFAVEEDPHLVSFGSGSRLAVTATQSG